MQREKHRMHVTKPFLLTMAVVCAVAGLIMLPTMFLTSIGLGLVVLAFLLAGIAFTSVRENPENPASDESGEAGEQKPEERP